MTIVISNEVSEPFTISITVTEDHERETLEKDILETINTSAHAGQKDEGIQLWLENAKPSDTPLLKNVGFFPYRDVVQMRCALPADETELNTRSFVVGDDEDAFIALNNRAFAWHPEQGNLNYSQLEELEGETWFNPEGFLLHEIDGRLAGFCWTKIHQDHKPLLGEIYVIAVDPDFHGQNLGKPMTLAGLNYLSNQGIDIGMLYVESDNVPALRVYEKLGFAHSLTNRAFRCSR
ncbi:MAG: mycothiol synthase [Acidimicrobiales bacterium]|nr:mycothiol synthase [Acidimicrobiales bacterium]